MVFYTPSVNNLAEHLAFYIGCHRPPAVAGSVSRLFLCLTFFVVTSVFALATFLYLRNESGGFLDVTSFFFSGNFRSLLLAPSSCGGVLNGATPSFRHSSTGMPFLLLLFCCAFSSRLGATRSLCFLLAFLAVDHRLSYKHT